MQVLGAYLAAQTPALAQPVASLEAPIEVEWEGLRACVQPPISQGVLLALTLSNMPQAANTAGSDLDHMGIELTKAAFEYRNRVAEGRELLNIRLHAEPTLHLRARDRELISTRPAAV